MIIDANMYWFPEEIFRSEKRMETFLSGIPATSGVNGYISSIEKNQQQFNQIVLEKPKGYQNLNY